MVYRDDSKGTIIADAAARRSHDALRRTHRYITLETRNNTHEGDTQHVSRHTL